jgi:hypothetical protein
VILLALQLVSYTATFQPGGQTETFSLAAMTCGLSIIGGSSTIQQGHAGQIVFDDPDHAGLQCTILSSVIPLLKAGTYTVTVTASDVSGTSAPSDPVSFRITRKRH